MTIKDSDMTSKKAADQNHRDIYKTTFSKEIEYEMSDFVSTSFIYGIIDAIAERMDIQKDEVSSEFRIEGGASICTTGSSNIDKLLHDSMSYKRRIKGLIIESGIVYGSNKQTHFVLSFNLHRYEKRVSATIHCYAGAENRDDSQAVIDWGNGTLSDFQDLRLLDIQPRENEFIINLKDGFVTKLPKGGTTHKVEIVNQVNVSPSKWSDVSNLIAIIGLFIVVALGLLAL